MVAQSRAAGPAPLKSPSTIQNMQKAQHEFYRVLFFFIFSAEYRCLVLWALNCAQLPHCILGWINKRPTMSLKVFTHSPVAPHNYAGRARSVCFFWSELKQSAFWSFFNVQKLRIPFVGVLSMFGESFRSPHCDNFAGKWFLGDVCGIAPSCLGSVCEPRRSVELSLSVSHSVNFSNQFHGAR